MKKQPLKSITLLVLILINPVIVAHAFHFNSNPESWTDSEVESFLFLSQVQKKSGLNKNSNLCMDVSRPVQGGKQRVRVISKSKVGDNKKGGLFQTAKAEIASDGSAKDDLNTIKKIVEMSTGYQQAIMDYDQSTAPVVNQSSTAKSYMSAEVIGYTDGDGIKGSLNSSITGSPKYFSSNKELGKLRADYLSEQLGLSNYFGSVKKTSKESESALKKAKYESIRNCDTWRTAEVRMYFQTGSKVTDDKTWVMSTMMMPEEERALIQFESVRQVREAMKELSDDILYDMVPPQNSAKAGASPTPAKKDGAPTTTDLVRVPSPELKNFCKKVLSALQGWTKNDQHQNFSACKPKDLNNCTMDCGGNVTYLNINLSNSGAPFSNIEKSITVYAASGEKYNGEYPSFFDSDKTKLKNYLANHPEVIAAKKVLDDKYNNAEIDHLKKKFPECEKNKEAFNDLIALKKRSAPYFGFISDRVGKTAERLGSSYLGTRENGKFVLKPDFKDLIESAVSRSMKDGSGAVTKGLKCLDMKRVMNVIYTKGECRSGDEFSKVTFPHKNAKLGCVYCGSGWNVTNSSVSYQERDTLESSPVVAHDHGLTYSRSTVEALRAPGIHEISNCPGCNCTDKGSKLSKVYSVEKVGDQNLVPKIISENCYCTPPVAPSCGVGPGGSVDDPSRTSLGQKYFYDACAGKFVAVTGDNKSAQILNLLNTFNKGCVSDPSKCSNVAMSSAIQTVNNMLCETQNYPIPTDDPIRDCAVEDQNEEILSELDS